MLRQHSGSVVCPECQRLVDVNEPTCPYCGRWRPGMFGFAPLLSRIFGSIDVTQMIMGACVLLYLLSLILDPSGVLESSRRGLFDLLSPSVKALFQLGMTGCIGRFCAPAWSVLSATYLHGSLLHIFFNMLWLRALGHNIEDSIGPARFFLIYNLTGAGGFLFSNYFSGGPTVGASGAIFGLLAASIVLGRHEGGSWGRYISQQAIVYSILLFVWGFMGERTNNWAHGGGFLVGYGVTRMMLLRIHRSEGPLLQLGALGLALATVLSVIGSFISVTARLMIR